MIIQPNGEEYDPERTLRKHGRRAFFLLGLGAAVAPFLPDVAAPVYESGLYAIGYPMPLTEEMIKSFIDQTSLSLTKPSLPRFTREAMRPRHGELSGL